MLRPSAGRPAGGRRRRRRRPRARARVTPPLRGPALAVQARCPATRGAGREGRPRGDLTVVDLIVIQGGAEMAVTVRALDNFVGGAWVTANSERVRRIVSPVTGETIAEAPDASRADVDAAVAAAR